MPDLLLGEGGTQFPQSSRTRDDLEITKLNLEIEELKEKGSLRKKSIESLQAVVPLAAMMTVAWTVWAGHQQYVSRTHETVETTFQTALSNLDSQSPSQRAAGVRRLGEFLGSDNGNRDLEILVSFVDQLSLETEPTVRQALVNEFDLASAKASPASRTAALEAVVDRQLVLEREGLLSTNQLATADFRQGGQIALPSNQDLTWDWSADSKPRFATDAEANLLWNLRALSDVFLKLLHAGSKTSHLQGLYCRDCDFTGLALQGADFRDAILAGVSFASAELPKANFERAFILNASFVHADLRGAIITADGSYGACSEDLAHAALDWSAFRISSTPDDFFQRAYIPQGPNFAWANLEDVDFGQQGLFTLVLWKSKKVVRWVQACAPDFYGARIAGAQLEGLATTDILYLSHPPKSQRDLPPVLHAIEKEGMIPDTYGMDLNFFFTSDPALPGRYTAFQHTGFQDPVAVNSATIANAIRDSFGWKSAHLSSGVRDYLQKQSVSERTELPVDRDAF